MGGREHVMKRAFWYAFKIFLVLRVATLAWLTLLSLLGGQAIGEPDVLCKTRTLVESSLQLGIGLSSWLRWDTNCYLSIAETGYAAHPELTVWPPFYPLLIHFLSFLVKPPILAALVISSLATWVVFFLLYLFITENHDETTAKNTVFLYAVYPVSFFLVAGYSESLFLALVVASLMLARRRYWGWAGFLAALATLTRNQGVVLPLVLLWEGMLQYREAKGLKTSEVFKILLAACLPILAFGAFAFYVHNTLNAPWPWHTLATLWGQFAGFPWEGILGNLKQLLTLPDSQDLYWLPTNVLDLLLAVLIPVMLIVHRHLIRSTWLVFAWMILLVALTKLGPNGTLVSFSRYLLAAFPFFVTLVPVMNNRYLRLAVFAFGLIFQAGLLAMFYNWSWAG